MNRFLSQLQKKSFAVLILIVLFFSFTSAYAIITSVKFFLNPIIIEKDKGSNSIQNANHFTAKPMTAYENMLEGNMIRGKKNSDPIIEDEVNPNPLVNIEPIIDDAVLTGTLSGYKGWSRITLKEKDAEEAEEFGLYKKVLGYTVKQIAEHSAILSKNGFNLKVEIGESIKDAKQKYIKKTQNENIPNSSESTKSNRKITKLISRTDFERKISDKEILADARMGPDLVNGKIEGYKIYQVAANHIFYQLGARSGDIVRRVNGMPLNDTQKLLEIWSHIKNSEKINIDLERKNEIISYEFQIRN